jgi:hypothetical protein
MNSATDNNSKLRLYLVMSLGVSLGRKANAEQLRGYQLRGASFSYAYRNVTDVILLDITYQIYRALYAVREECLTLIWTLYKVRSEHSSQRVTSIDTAQTKQVSNTTELRPS